MIAVQLGPRTIYEKVTNQSLRRMNLKLCRLFLLLDIARPTLHSTGPEEMRRVICQSFVTYLYIVRGPPIPR